MSLLSIIQNIPFRSIALGSIVLLIVLLARAYFIPHMTQKRLLGDQATFKKLQTFKAPMAMQNLSKAIQIKTISGGKLLEDPGAFQKSIATFRRFLEATYPNVFAKLERIDIDSPSLLLRWKGSDASKGAVGLMAHMDVVPVEAGTSGDWKHAPFSGTIEGGYLWGRGTLDDKSSLIAIFEAVEVLLQNGFVPPRDLYFVFGHDEEVGGNQGAKKAASWFAKNNIKLDYVLDEGSAIIQGDLLGTKRNVALISIAEKGVVGVELKVESEGGHASMPPLETPISILSAGILRLQENPFPARFTDIHTDIMQTLALSKPLLERLLLTNLWLFKPLVISQLLQNPPTAAQLRTTTAPTILKAGSKENVLPQSSTAILNVRIHPEETVASVIAEIKRKMGDERIIVSKYSTGFEPPKISDKTSDGFRRIEAHLQTITGKVLVSPSISIASTDSKHFNDVAKNIYRILPMILSKAAIPTIHGTGEKISIKEVKRMVQFYQLLMQQPE